MRWWVVFDWLGGMTWLAVLNALPLFLSIKNSSFAPEVARTRVYVEVRNFLVLILGGFYHYY